MSKFNKWAGIIVEYYTAVNWRNSRCAIPEDKKVIIEQIAGAKIFGEVQ
jgi:hypothetical protein